MSNNVLASTINYVCYFYWYKITYLVLKSNCYTAYAHLQFHAPNLSMNHWYLIHFEPTVTFFSCNACSAPSRLNYPITFHLAISLKFVQKHSRAWLQTSVLSYLTWLSAFQKHEWLRLGLLGLICLMFYFVFCHFCCFSTIKQKGAD